MFLYTSQESIVMIIKDSHSPSSSGTFKSGRLKLIRLKLVPLLLFIYLSSQTGEAFNSIF